MAKKFKYSIWQSGCGWHVSRLDGKNDKHVIIGRELLAMRGLTATKQYFKENELSCEVHPLDDDLAKSALCIDTFEYRKEREYVR